MNDPKAILDEVKKAVVGKDGVLIMALLSILAGGHILLEDIPGVGKTTMALAFSKALNLKYNRVQFTPDVLPSDIVGFSVFNKATNEMEYKQGAILCNLFLADELNRATSRTQSALLEAMEEGNVTVEILEYIIRLNNATRIHGDILQGASPRASLAVTNMSKAAAWVQGRDYVLPQDVKLIYPPTVTHRLLLSPDAEAAGKKAADLVSDIMKSVAAPALK